MSSLDAESILITGGSDGIGLGLARRFLSRGATVLVTGRSSTKLATAARELPALRTIKSDASRPEEREALAVHVREQLPNLTWLINNAGIQRRVSLALDTAPWAERQQELDLLLAAPIHLNHLLAPLLVAQPRPTVIVNVSSGGAFVPQVFAPVYSACKAALHSYSGTLRHALARTQCRVVELIPPAVQTSLANPPHGAPLDEFCDAVFAELIEGSATHVGYGPTRGIEQLSPSELEAAFTQSANRANVQRYEKPT